MEVLIVPASEPDRLADAELHFTEGPLAHLKLVGFAIVAPCNGDGPTVTFPARQYVMDGETRSFSLLRPLDVEGLHAVRELYTLILDAYKREQVN